MPVTDPLHSVYLTDTEREALAAALGRKGVFCVESPPPAARAFLAWNLLTAFPRPWLWVLDGPRALDEFRDNLLALAAGREGQWAVFPAFEVGAGGARRQPETTGERLHTLLRVQAGGPLVVATCIQALLQPVPPPEVLSLAHVELCRGGEWDFHGLLARIEAAGYRFRPEVAERGDAAVRGGIVDAWSPHAEYPVRAEFVGSAIESLRLFDPLDQRSIRPVERVLLLPAKELAAEADFSVLLPADFIAVWSDPERIAEQAQLHQKADAAATAFSRLREQLDAGRPSLELRPPEEAAAGALPLAWRAIEPVPSLSVAGGEPEAVQRLRAEFVARVAARARRGARAFLFFRTSGARDRFLETFGAGMPPGMVCRLGPLSGGFETGDGRLVAVAESDLYGERRGPSRRERRARRRAALAAADERVAEISAVQPGEYVVHVEHGIGRYLGLHEIEVGGVRQEVLTVEYAEGARLHVPADQAHLLSRYRGVGGRAPELHRLGGTRWQREKAGAELAVRALAARLLRTQALRETRQGHAFSSDHPWMAEFEAAFPFDETEDQLRAIADTRRDMEASRPMDRLICGDVGYGKTEVAMRAAFRAVLNGKQAAVLVPTTVLAQQHYETFRERMAAYPVAIEMLSRFRTPAEQADIVRRVREGRVDIVIGTHRLVQPDVAFRDLGLIVIDEEQRFGVAHKELLKDRYPTVDVLTLTATPIPRTLYLSLVGARDLSVIQTAPRERLPIETIVCPYDDAVVREAILRELDRGGQVFYLHNRVQTIEIVHERLARLVPEAVIGVAHGRQNERRLAAVMRDFARGDTDVLLCTAIVESGVDIPNVNTILIDRADRFGLADLYQLRGRVGRFKQRAHAYLLLPRHGRLFDSARRRIEAIRRHSGLGAGFQLALRDLETRGAGNLLGAEQSGHIAAVGFELYCQLLRRAVAALQGRPLPPLIRTRVHLDFVTSGLPTAAAEEGLAPAGLPVRYMEDENLRLQTYRRIASIATEAEARAVREDLRDRFGLPPPETERLLQIARIRVRAAALGADAVETEEDRLIVRVQDEPWMPGGRYPRLQKTDPDERLDEILRWLRRMAATPRLPSGPGTPHESRPFLGEQGADSRQGSADRGKKYRGS